MPTLTVQPETPGAPPGLARVLDDDDHVALADLPAGLTPSALDRLYRAMALVRSVDERMVTLQRQGRITFYGAATGQEAAVIGSGYAFEAADWVVPALREGGVALLRGLSLSDYVNQCFGNGNDVERGRQMPCHYGHRDVKYVTLSSCIANQLPHAVGIALAARLRGDKAIAVGYMGDGATSEGDFHTSLEFAAQLRSPTLFFCQNNQWAISTGIGQQMRAKSLAAKAHGYGMPGYRVDGNDVLAVYAVTKAAVQHIRQTGSPAFVEALTYRVGAHSTSDDPSRYRDESITEAWKSRDPLRRLRRALDHLGLWDDARDTALFDGLAEQVKAEIVRAEAAPAPTLASLFEDVYETVPAHLRAQQAALQASLLTAPAPTSH